MSRLEDIVYSAYELGKREDLFKEIARIKSIRQETHVPLEEIYEEAYRTVCNTG